MINKILVKISNIVLRDQYRVEALEAEIKKNMLELERQHAINFELCNNLEEIKKDISKISEKIDNKVDCNNIILIDTYSGNITNQFYNTNDPIRYATFYLALKDLDDNKVNGPIAELGVWRGYTTRIINKYSPNRDLYLFDTFDGFDAADLSESLSEQSSISKIEGWFSDGDLKFIDELNNPENVNLFKGKFPDTLDRLDKSIKFALVSLDFDLYKPTKEALEYFSTKMVRGGYIFIHDYNLPVFEWGVKRAVEECLNSKAITAIQIPDKYGSIVLKF